MCHVLPRKQNMSVISEEELILSPRLVRSTTHYRWRPRSPCRGRSATQNSLKGLAFIILIMAPVGVEAASHVVAALASEQRLQ